MIKTHIKWRKVDDEMPEGIRRVIFIKEDQSIGTVWCVGGLVDKGYFLREKAAYWTYADEFFSQFPGIVEKN